MFLVTIIATVRAKPEAREELQTLLAAQVVPTRGRSQADLDAHMTMPHLRPLLSAIDRLLSRPVEIRHLRMLSGTE